MRIATASVLEGDRKNAAADGGKDDDDNDDDENDSSSSKEAPPFDIVKTLLVRPSLCPCWRPLTHTQKPLPDVAAGEEAVAIEGVRVQPFSARLEYVC